VDWIAWLRSTVQLRFATKNRLDAYRTYILRKESFSKELQTTSLIVLSSIIYDLEFVFGYYLSPCQVDDEDLQANFTSNVDRNAIAAIDPSGISFSDLYYFVFVHWAMI